jgi:hypothetical protein
MAIKQPFWLHYFLVRQISPVVLMPNLVSYRVGHKQVLPVCLTAAVADNVDDDNDDIDWMGMSVTERQERGVALANLVRVLAVDPLLASDKHAELRRNCSNIINFMESAVMCVQPSGDLNISRGGDQMKQNYGMVYDAVFMLRCLRQTMMLRSSADLMPSLQNACRILLPAQCSDYFDKVLASTSVPHKSTLSRFLLQADVGWMVYQRKCMATLLASDDLPICYFMADSSEQAGTDWLISSYKTISSSSLLQAADAVDELSSWFEVNYNMQAVAEGEYPPAIPWDIKAAEEFLVEELTTVILPPAGVGARHGSLTHKLHGKLHSSRLHMPTTQALQVFTTQCIVSHTTDMGTELAFNDARGNVTSFVKHFRDPTVASSAPVSLIDIMSGHADGSDAVEGMDSEQLADSGEQPPNEVRIHGFALTIPGLLHILHKAVVDMSEALQHFTWFFKPFNSLLTMMQRKIHRSLVIGTCYAKPPASHWAKQVRKLHGKLLLERWSLLIDKVVDTLCLQVPLVTYWDPVNVTQTDKKPYAEDSF